MYIKLYIVYPINPINSIPFLFLVQVWSIKICINVWFLHKWQCINLKVPWLAFIVPSKLTNNSISDCVIANNYDYLSFEIQSLVFPIIMNKREMRPNHWCPMWHCIKLLFKMFWFWNDFPGFLKVFLNIACECFCRFFRFRLRKKQHYDLDAYQWTNTK